MKKIKSNIACFISGILIASTVGAIAATYTATPNEFPIKINGQNAQIEGYNIDGSTYFKLRDIGDKIGFDVDFDNNIIYAEAVSTPLKNMKDYSEAHQQSKVLMTDGFEIGEKGQARTVVNENGIQSYNAENQKHGLWSNPQWGDFYIYYKDKEVLKLINGNPNDDSGNYSLYIGGTHVILVDSNGDIQIGEGTGGSFVTGDGKTVTVVGGIITDIS